MHYDVTNIYVCLNEPVVQTGQCGPLLNCCDGVKKTYRTLSLTKDETKVNPVL